MRKQLPQTGTSPLLPWQESQRKSIRAEMGPVLEKAGTKADEFQALYNRLTRDYPDSAYRFFHNLQILSKENAQFAQALLSNAEQFVKGDVVAGNVLFTLICNLNEIFIKSEQECPVICQALLGDTNPKLAKMQKWQAEEFGEMCSWFGDNPIASFLLLDLQLKYLDAGFSLKELAEYAKRDSANSIQILSESDQEGNRILEGLKKAVGRVAFFSEAASSYSLPKLLEWVAGRGVHVSEGEWFATDGKEVFLPSKVDIYPTKEENMNAYRLGGAHEGWHIRYGTFRVNAGEVEVGKIDARIEEKGKQKILFVRIKGEEAMIEIKHGGDLYLAFKNPSLAQWLHNILEDGRIDACGRRDYQAISEQRLEHKKMLLGLRNAPRGEGELSYLEAFCQLVCTGETNVPLSETMQGKLASLMEVVDAMKARPGYDATDSFNAMIEIYLKIVKDMPEIEEMQEEDMPDEFSNSSGHAKNRIVYFQKTKPKESQPGKDKNNENPAQESGKNDSKEPGGTSPKTQKNDSSSEELAGYKPFGPYDRLRDGNIERNVEWIFQNTLSTPVPRPDSRIVARIEKVLRALRPSGLHIERNQPFGVPDPALEEIHEGYEQMGILLPNDFYTRKGIVKRDISVLVLVDCSGSTGRAVRGNKTEIDIENDALLAFSEALNNLGDRHEILAYEHNFGRNLIHVAKGADDLHVTGLPSDGSNNCDAAAFRHGTKRLMEMGGRKKIMLVLADNESGDIENVAAAAREARRKGIIVYGLDINPEGDLAGEHGEILRNIYGSAFRRANSLDEIPAGLAQIYRRVGNI